MQKVHGAQVYELSILPRTLERVMTSRRIARGATGVSADSFVLLFRLKSRWFALCPVSSPCRSHGIRALRAMYAYSSRPTPTDAEMASKEWAPWSYRNGQQSDDDSEGESVRLEKTINWLTNSKESQTRMRVTSEVSCPVGLGVLSTPPAQAAVADESRPPAQAAVADELRPPDQVAIADEASAAADSVASAGLGKLAWKCPYCAGQPGFSAEFRNERDFEQHLVDHHNEQMHHSVINPAEMTNRIRAVVELAFRVPEAGEVPPPRLVLADVLPGCCAAADEGAENLRAERAFASESATQSEKYHLRKDRREFAREELREGCTTVNLSEDSGSEDSGDDPSVDSDDSQSKPSVEALEDQGDDDEASEDNDGHGESSGDELEPGQCHSQWNSWKGYRWDGRIQLQQSKHAVNLRPRSRSRGKMERCPAKYDCRLRAHKGVPLPDDAPMRPKTGPRPKGVEKKKTHESRLRRRRDNTGYDPECALPPCVGGNFSMNSVVVGPRVDWDQFATWLADSQWHIVVIKLLDCVGIEDLQRKFREVCSRSGAVELTDGEDPGMDVLLKSKSVHEVFDGCMYAAHNRFQVTAVAVCRFRFRKPPKSVEGPLCEEWRAQFAKVTVRLDTTKQRLALISYGVFNCSNRILLEQPVVDIPHVKWKLDCVVDCTRRHGLQFITGWFGNDPTVVEHIGYRGNAVLDLPLVQVFSEKSERWTDDTGQSRGREYHALPQYTVIFSDYRNCDFRWEERPPISELQKNTRSRGHESPFRLQINGGAMVQWFGKHRGEGVGPRWPPNDRGAPLVPSVGAIKLKAVTWERANGVKNWIPHVYQTPLWLGTSVPSKSSQERQEQRIQAKGKKKGKQNKGKGKGKTNRANGKSKKAHPWRFVRSRGR